MLFRHLSVSTCLGELNEITVIQIDRREEEIQMPFSSSPVSDSASLSPRWIIVSPLHLHLSSLFTCRVG